MKQKNTKEHDSHGVISCIFTLTPLFFLLNSPDEDKKGVLESILVTLILQYEYLGGKSEELLESCRDVTTPMGILPTQCLYILTKLISVLEGPDIRNKAKQLYKVILSEATKAWIQHTGLPASDFLGKGKVA